MSHSFDEISQQLKRRHRKSARLKWISMGALGLAGLFLVLFFADMLSKGLPAFQQAYINTEVRYTEEASRDGRQAFDQDLIPLISRTVVRVIPLQLRNNCRRRSQRILRCVYSLVIFLFRFFLFSFFFCQPLPRNLTLRPRMFPF